MLQVKSFAPHTIRTRICDPSTAITRAPSRSVKPLFAMCISCIGLCDATAADAVFGASPERYTVPGEFFWAGTAVKDTDCACTWYNHKAANIIAATEIMPAMSRFFEIVGIMWIQFNIMKLETGGRVAHYKVHVHTNGPGPRGPALSVE